MKQVQPSSNQPGHVGKNHAAKTQDVVLKKIRCSYLRFLIRHKLDEKRSDEYRSELNKLRRQIVKLQGHE